MNIRAERIYYNEEQKNRFLQSDELQETGYPHLTFFERVFISTCPYEEELGKDIYNFTTPEIQSMYKRIGFASVNIVANINSALRKYTQFCLNNNMVFDYQNHFAEFKPGDFPAYVSNNKKNRRIITRKELLIQMAYLNNASDAYALLCLFEGIDGPERTEILNLRTTDLDEENLTAKLCTGRTVKISRKLIDTAIEAASTDTYVAQSGRSIVFREDPTLIYKSFNNAKEDTSDYQKGRKIYIRFKRNFTELGLETLTVSSIKDSGKIHMIREIAKEMNLDYSDTKTILSDKDLIKRVEDQYDCYIYPHKANFYNQYKEYLEAPDNI